MQQLGRGVPVEEAALALLLLPLLLPGHRHEPRQRAGGGEQRDQALIAKPLQLSGDALRRRADLRLMGNTVGQGTEPTVLVRRGEVLHRLLDEFDELRSLRRLRIKHPLV